MANYAILDEDNIVVEVIAGVEETETIDGLDPETYYGNLFGKRCLRTSYNTHADIHSGEKEPFRKNFAKIGDKYDEVGFFNPNKPFPSWTFNTKTYLYDAPIAKPTTSGGTVRNWNLETLTWDEITIPYVRDWKWNESEQNWEILPMVVYDLDEAPVDPTVEHEDFSRKYFVWDQETADRWEGLPVPPQLEWKIAANLERERLLAENE